MSRLRDRAASLLSWTPYGVRDVVLILLGLGVLALSVGIQVSSLDFTLGRIATKNMRVHVDFDTFWLSARAFWSGAANIYRTGATFPNLNPPLWTLLMLPLGLLQNLLAYRIFTLATVLLTLAYTAWTVGKVGLSGGRASLVTGLVLFSSPFLATLALGQVYAYLTLGLIAAWYFDRREMPVASGIALGLTIALKPTLLPLLLWTIARRRWRAALSCVLWGATATLIAAFTLGFGATFDWARLVLDQSLNTYWDNASLPAAIARLFTHNPYARPLATVPWLVAPAYVLGVVIVAATAWSTRRDPSLGLWTLTAASLLASPIAWNNYLMLLVPGVLILAGRGRFALAFFLLCLQTIPAQWPLLWQSKTPLDTVMLTLYLFILLAHWISFLVHEPLKTAPPPVRSLAPDSSPV